MRFEDFKSSDFQEKLMAASSPEELLATAKEVGLELTDEQLEAMSGGAWDFIADSYVTCSNCGKDTYYSSNEGVPVFCGFCGDSITFSD